MLEFEMNLFTCLGWSEAIWESSAVHYHYATSGETCVAVPQNECAAAGNAVTGWNKASSEVRVGDWSWVPCGCYIWRGANIQFNTHACNQIVLNDSGRVNGQAVCKVKTFNSSALPN